MAIIDIDPLFDDDDDNDQVNDQKVEHVASSSESRKGFIGESWDWFCAGIRRESSFSWLKFMASAAVPISVTFLTLQQMDAASNQQRHEIMSTYLEEMTDLLVDKGLRLSDRNTVSPKNVEAEAKAEQGVAEFSYDFAPLAPQIWGEPSLKVPHSGGIRGPTKLQHFTIHPFIQQRLEQRAEAKRMAEAITLNAASQLYENQSWLSKLLRQPNPNGEHKGKLIKFLYQAELIGSCPIADDKTMKVDKTSCKPAELNLSGIKLNEMFLDRPVIRLIGIDLSRSDLSDSKLSELDLNAAKLQGATLTEADLSKTVLSDAEMQGAVLQNADLTEAMLIRTNLQRANLRAARLLEAKLQKADLSGADLSGANLSGANLREATLTKTKFNSKTVLPEGIDKTGMLRCAMVKDKNSNRLIEDCQLVK